MQEDNAIHIGTNVKTGDPVFVPLQLFKQHCVIRGMTGAMKSVFAVYITLQLIVKTAAYVVYDDLGKDRFAFHAVRELALSENREFRFTSTRWTDAWHTFYPLQVFTPLAEEKVPIATDFLATALSLEHGEGFGKSFYGKVNRGILQDTLSLCVKEGLLSPTMPELAERAAKIARQYRKSDASESALTLSELAPYPQLRDADSPDGKLDVRAGLECGQVHFGLLGAILEAPARRIAAMLAFAVAAAAMERFDDGEPPRDVFVIIDEFATVAHARAFELLLTLVRKARVFLILLHQSSDQLRDPRGSDLRPIVRDNTAVKLYLTSIGDDIDDLRDMSRDVLKTRRGKSYQGLSVSNQVSEIYEPELERNDVLDASASAGQGYLLLNTGLGHEEPIRIKFAPIYFTDIFTPERHEELSRKEIPQRTVPASNGHKSGGDSEELRAPRMTPERRARLDKMRAVLEATRVKYEYELGA